MKLSIIFLCLCMVLWGCAHNRSDILQFSKQWILAQSRNERGFVLKNHIKTVNEYFMGQNQQMALDILGDPDYKNDGEYLYNVGNFNGDYEWQLLILFDENGIIEAILLDESAYIPAESAWKAGSQKSK